MRRRDMLMALPAAMAASAAVAQVPRLTGVRIKVTDIKILRLRVIKDLGMMAGYNGPWDMNRVIVGGGSAIEVHTDQGLVGIGPAIDPVQLPRLKADVIGRDAFDLQRIIADLRDVTGLGSDRRIAASAPPEAKAVDPTLMTLAAAAGRGGDASTDRANAAIEIALWDIIGKACNQPLYKLWGPVRDSVVPYASQSRLDTPESRARFAAKIQADGWRAIKFRAHFKTMKEDVRLVEETRKLVGDDFDIMVDANQATNGFLSPDLQWGFQRAVETARAYQQLKVYWLEEPLRRYDYDHLAELNRLVEIPIAGGEGNRGLHEFRDLLERGCFDIVQPEILLEGPLEIRKIGIMAEAMDKQVAPHLGDGRIGSICSMHVIATMPNATYLETDHDLPLRDYSNGFAIFEEPPVLQKDGAFAMPQKPGLGMTIKKDMILT